MAHWQKCLVCGQESAKVPYELQHLPGPPCFPCQAPYERGFDEAIVASVAYHVGLDEKRLARYLREARAYELAYPERFQGQDPITHLVALLRDAEYAKLHAQVADCRRWLDTVPT
jgi:hypothetical protein